MFIAHLPAGYLLGKVLEFRSARLPGVVAATMIGSVAPDLDMFRFYLDGGQTHHHAYFTHWPAFWGAILLMSLVLFAIFWRPVFALAAAFSLGGLGHMVLDSVAAPINWTAPFGTYRVELVEVPAAYSHWITSYVVHWTFLIEIAICAAAIVLYVLTNRQTKRAA